MQTIKEFVARLNLVDPRFLEFIGIQDERLTVGKVIYQFNITDPNHPRFKSTVSFIEQED